MQGPSRAVGALAVRSIRAFEPPWVLARGLDETESAMGPHSDAIEAPPRHLPVTVNSWMSTHIPHLTCNHRNQAGSPPRCHVGGWAEQRRIRGELQLLSQK